MSNLYANPENISSFVDLMNYTQNATKLYSVSGTVVLENVFGLMLLVAVWFVAYMSLNVRWSAIKSFATASWITMIFSVGMTILGLVVIEHTIMIVIMAFVGLLLLFLDDGGVR